MTIGKRCLSHEVEGWGGGRHAGVDPATSNDGALEQWAPCRARLGKLDATSFEGVGTVRVDCIDCLGSARHTTARVLGALFTRSVCTHYSSMRASAAAFMMWDSSGVVLTLWWESLSRWLVHASGLRVLYADDMCCLFAYLSPEAAQHTH